MTETMEANSLLVALEFVIMVGILLLIVPIKVVAPAIPLALVFLLALFLYRS